MKKYISILLSLCFLAGCKAPAVETPVPTASSTPTLPERLAQVRPEDLLLEERSLLWPGPEPTAEELAPLLREAAESPVDHARAEVEKNMLWDVGFTLLGEEEERWTMSAGTEENVVWFHSGQEEYWLENQGLYQLVRTSDDIFPDIDEEAYDKYRTDIDLHYGVETALQNAAEEKQGLPDRGWAEWELTMLRPAAEREEWGVKVYRLQKADVINPPEKAYVRLAGGAWLDSGLRVLGGGWQYTYLGVRNGEAVGVFSLEWEIDLSQYASVEEFLDMAEANRGPAYPGMGLFEEDFPTGAAPDRGDLTREEVDRANEAFYWQQITAEGYKTSTPINGFFRSYYADVREMDFGAFIGYYPADSEDMDQEERDKVYEISRFDEIPAHRVRRAYLDETLERYAGITAAELDTSEEIYIDEYDSWYYYASDFDPGRFICEGGRVEGDTVTLWTAEDRMGIRRELTLKKEDGVWHIKSHLPASMDRSRSLETFVLGLTEGEVEEITGGWGFPDRGPETEEVVELLQKAVLKPTYSWEYEREGEPLVWDMTLRLTDGKTITLRAGLVEDVVEVTYSESAYGSYFRSPELYWILRTENDSSGEGKGTIDQSALEKYREAVDSYLKEQAWDPAVRVELTGFHVIQESAALNAQVWAIGTDLTTDPPELAVNMVGNGYVDSKLRMYPITSDGPDCLLVTTDGEALGFQNWTWLEEGGLDRYATVEELRGNVR